MPNDLEVKVDMTEGEEESGDDDLASIVYPLLHDHHAHSDIPRENIDKHLLQPPEDDATLKHFKTAPGEMHHVRVRRFSTSSSKRLFTVFNYGNVDDASEVESVVTSPSVSETCGFDFSQGRKSSRATTYSGLGSNHALSDVTGSFHVGEQTESKDDHEQNREPHVHFTAGGDSADSINKESNAVYSSWTSKLPDIEVARRGRLFSKRRQQRLVNKRGESNFVYKNMESSRIRWISYIRDMFTTLLDTKWRYIILLFVLAFVLSWLVFALLWWGLGAYHGDANSDQADERCVIGVYDFQTAMLFSIETQHTIGYGSRSITTACKMGMLVLMAQSVVGVLIQCIITGIVFAKIARPKGRSQTFLFSRNAVILQRDGHLWLVLRIGDMRRSQIICTNVNAIMVRRKTTEEGEEIPLFYHQLKVTTESEDDFFFMAWPLRVVHKVDSDSPLWDISAENLLVGDFEIIVVLEGVNETTGMTTQFRTSYLPAEILWGHRFVDLAACQKESGLYHIDYTRFNDTYPVDMGEFSAHDLCRRRESIRSIKSRFSNGTVYSYEDEL